MLESTKVIQNPIEITLYLVGKDRADAANSLPFDSAESAESYQRDNLGTKLYSVDAYIDPSTIEEIEDQ